MDFTNIIYWILIGGTAGWIAGLIVGGKGKGCITNIFVGILGSFVGGFVFEILREQGIINIQIHSFVISIIGSIILLLILNLFKD